MGRFRGLKAIVPYLGNLTELYLNDLFLKIGSEEAIVIAKKLLNLNTLQLVGNKIDANGAKEIATHLTKLTDLNLMGNEIGAEGADVFQT